MDENIKYIRSMSSKEELLAQIAEEAAELAQAALKLRRAIIKNNPTPVSKIEATARLIEEIADVRLCIDASGIIDNSEEDVNYIYKNKLERWATRLKDNSK